jgi:hypothetical protein
MLRKAILVGLGGLLAFGAIRWQLAGRLVEEPAYAVERDLGGGSELRRYEPCVRAETIVEASTSEAAANAGFRRLAGYIFGGNERAEKIAMTAPVSQAKAGETIAMTAPVTQVAAGDGRWLVTFTMPRGRTIANLPTPKDAAVSLHAIPARRVAVLRYSGTTPPDRVAAMEASLRDALVKAGIEAPGTALSARYDPPSVLPFLRRNEIWIELD